MTDTREVVTLREYTDMRFEEQGKAVSAALVSQKEAISAALAAAKEAVNKAEIATEKRFENSNEWRDTVEALQKTYAPRREMEQMQKILWIGLGLVLACQFFVGLGIIIWKSKT